MYNLSQFELDVLYLPTDKGLPAILVKDQNSLSPISMAEPIQFCTSLYEEYEAIPIQLLILTKGYSSEAFKVKFETNNDKFLAKAYCKLWAKHYYIMSPESICKFLNLDSLNELLALNYFLRDSKACLKEMIQQTKLFLELLKKKKVYNCTCCRTVTDCS